MYKQSEKVNESKNSNITNYSIYNRINRLPQQVVQCSKQVLVEGKHNYKYALSESNHSGIAIRSLPFTKIQRKIYTADHEGKNKSGTMTSKDLKKIRPNSLAPMGAIEEEILDDMEKDELEHVFKLIFKENEYCDPNYSDLEEFGSIITEKEWGEIVFGISARSGGYTWSRVENKDFSKRDFFKRVKNDKYDLPEENQEYYFGGTWLGSSEGEEIAKDIQKESIEKREEYYNNLEDFEKQDLHQAGYNKCGVFITPGDKYLDKRPEYTPALNCVEGVCEYINEKVDNNFIKNELSPLLDKNSEINRDKAEIATPESFYKNLHISLGFGDSSEFQKGPFHLDEFKQKLSKSEVPENTILSIGDNKGTGHMMTMLSNNKVKSLWSFPMDGVVDADPIPIIKQAFKSGKRKLKEEIFFSSKFVKAKSSISERAEKLLILWNRYFSSIDMDTVTQPLKMLLMITEERVNGILDEPMSAREKRLTSAIEYSKNTAYRALNDKRMDQKTYESFLKDIT